MKLSVSNIAWPVEFDDQIYEYLTKKGFSGLEIAPTRLFNERPYDRLQKGQSFSAELKFRHKLDISSMQSIWFGRQENIFGSNSERQTLIEYTRKAVDFAEAIGCGNLVFGCPKNRNIESPEQYPIAIDFFRTLGQYACEKNTIISVEANPIIYGTNFINYTYQAFELAKSVESPGIGVNIDFGTIIQNNESLKIVNDNIAAVNHIHISEPYLACIEKRSQHVELAEILRKNNYQKFVSIEMKDFHDIEALKKVIQYVKEVFA